MSRVKLTARLWLITAAVVIVAAAAALMDMKQKGDHVSMQPDYKGYIIHKYDELTQQIDYDAMRKRLSDPRRLAYFASMAAQLHQLTGDPKYAEQSLKTFQTIMDEWRRKPELYKNHDNGFFVMEPLLIAYQHLKSLGKISSEDEALVRAYLPYGAVRQMVDNNQGLSRAAGVALALRLFPEHPDSKKWKANLDELWNYWYANKDLDENAGNYNSIGLAALIRFAALTDRTELLKTADVRRMFERYRDLQTPAGIMPEYGDDYFGEWKTWVYVFEAAARLYNDPTYLEAARKAFAYGTRNFPVTYVPGKFDENLWSVDGMHEMAGVLTLSAMDRKPSALPGGSLVARRNEPGHPGASDKLILSASRQPGTPYIVSELYGRGYHAHTNRIGAVFHYETDNIPLFHGLNRNNRSATDSNVLAVLPPDEPFPVPNGSVSPGEWQHESVPVRGIVTGEPQDDDTFTLDDITLRLSAKKEVTFVIDNLRLEGPAGVKTIDDFETLVQWDRSDKPYSLGTNASSGKHTLQVNVKPGAGVFYNNKGYNATFSLKDYTTIKYDWTYMAPVKTDFDFLFRTWVKPNDGVPLHVDFFPSDVNQVPLVSDAKAESKSGDSYGEIAMAEYGTFDTKAKRKMLLSREGILALVDELLPGPSASGYAAGPIWHLYTMGEHGTNWFDSRGETKPWYAIEGEAAEAGKSLLVYYDTADGRTFGVSNVEMNGFKPFTTFAKQTLTASKPVRFVTVLVPHAPNEAPGELASRIQVQHNGDETIVKLNRTAADSLSMRVGPSAWSVERTK